MIRHQRVGAGVSSPYLFRCPHVSILYRGSLLSLFASGIAIPSFVQGLKSCFGPMQRSACLGASFCWYKLPAKSAPCDLPIAVHLQLVPSDWTLGRRFRAVCLRGWCLGRQENARLMLLRVFQFVPCADSQLI